VAVPVLSGANGIRFHDPVHYSFVVGDFSVAISARRDRRAQRNADSDLDVIGPSVSEELERITVSSATTRHLATHSAPRMPVENSFKTIMGAGTMLLSQLYLLCAISNPCSCPDTSVQS
jgi:hypothetical protein